MKDKRCEPVRRELEELSLNEAFSATAAGHLRTCAGCQQFRREQTKLRQIVGSLGTVNAPADFDFRLRARLAADSQASGFRYWSFAMKGLATATILVVFGAAVAVIWQRGARQGPVAQAPQPSAPAGPKRPDQPKTMPSPIAEVTPTIAADNAPKQRVERPFVVKPKRSLAALDFSSERANVISNTTPVSNTGAVFPIDASLQSLKVSLDDGRGNARTISFPTVSFGSQRVLTNANQSSSRGVW